MKGQHVIRNGRSVPSNMNLSALRAFACVDKSGVAAGPRRRRDAPPSHDDVGGRVLEFEAFRGPEALSRPGHSLMIMKTVSRRRRAPAALAAASTPSTRRVSIGRRVDACWIVSTCWATTDSTSRIIRLNSSKQAQAPEAAKPLKNLAIAL